jgi:hypothetical protein
MEPNDLTIGILKGIRDEVRGVREEVREQVQGLRQEMRSGLRDVRGELGGMRVDLEGLRDEVHGVRDYMHEMDVRLSSEVVAFAGVVRQMSENIRVDRALCTRVDDHEQRLGALERVR